MYENIMIPVSFDEDRDLDRAAEVAHRMASPGARIIFFHVMEAFPTYVADFIPPDAWQDRRTAAHAKVDALAEDTDNAEGIVVDGTSGRSITSWARDKGVDLIVIASHRPQMSDIFLGSTAAWVVRHADCAVHVIR